MKNKQLNSAVQVIGALAEAIREFGSVPSGEMYATVCGHLDLAEYQACLRILKGAGLVSESNHVLTWIGPKLEG